MFKLSAFVIFIRQLPATATLNHGKVRAISVQNMFLSMVMTSRGIECVSSSCSKLLGLEIN